MPLYEYECGRCGHRFERIQRFSDPLVETCPECDGPVRKLISAPAIQFKGDGWYVTDYARKEEKQKAARSKGGKSKSKEGSGSSSSKDGD
jgi:putative FmdB family regulatory protein